MPEQPGDQLFSDGQPFTGAHPTNREFVEQLRAWGFTRRKEDGVHVVFRGPKGGTVRVIRSQLGRADTVAADKAARLAGVTAAQFWAGPPQPGHQAQAPAPPRRRGGGRAAPGTVSPPWCWPSTRRWTGRWGWTRLSSCPGTG